MVICSVNTAGFLVTVVAATTFFVELECAVWTDAGGIIAGPLGAYLAKYVSTRPLMLAVGLLVILLAGIQIARSF